MRQDTLLPMWNALFPSIFVPACQLNTDYVFFVSILTNLVLPLYLVTFSYLKTMKRLTYFTTLTLFAFLLMSTAANAQSFELSKAKDGQFYFNLKATNGQVILTSEMYTTKAAAENGIASVQKNASTDARYEVRKNKKGEPYFVLKAANGQIIGTSEGYSSDAACKNGMESVKKNGPTAKTKQTF